MVPNLKLFILIQEFWEQKFNCSLAEKPVAGVRQCTGI